MPARTPVPRVLIVGCGSIGLRHLRNLRALGVKDVLACDPDPSRSAAAVAEGATAVDSLADAWSLSPTVTFVTAPTSSHVEIAREAVAHGSHLFVEKPLAASLDGVQALLDEVRAARVVTMGACNMRFHHGPKTIKRLVERGVAGQIVSILVDAGQYLPDWHPDLDYRRGYSARAALGGGVVLDGIHEIDYCRWIFGDVSAVSAMGGHLSRLEIDTEDTANILLQFASGSVGALHLDYVQRTYARSCKVIGDRGTIEWDMTAQLVRWFDGDARQWHDEPAPDGYGVNDMYVEELRHLLACLAGMERSTHDVADAARVLEIALAARRSMDTGERVEVGGREAW